jgi:membrane protease YdiL (CAAX protease family)
MINYTVPDTFLMSGSIAIPVATLTFLVYHFIFTSERINNRFMDKFGTPGASIRKVLYQRILGGVLYGLVPLLIIVLVFRRPLGGYGFSGENLAKSFLLWMPVGLVVVGISYFLSKNEKNLARYPQIRISEWNTKILLVSALTWIVYLVGYEFMFRGFLLFSCLESFGYWPAILINICLYSLVHVPKGATEAFGSLLLGAFLCYLTLFLGSFWLAVFIHVTIALSTEWFSLGFQPDMKLTKTRLNK